MVQFIDDHRDAYGVESICTVVPIAPSTYFWHKAPTQIPRDGAHGSTATTGGAGRFSASGTTTSRSMARARSGGNCDATATAWRAVRWAA